MTSRRNAFLKNVAQTSPAPDGFEVSHGEGIYLFDLGGQAYLDCISGITVSSFGHHHPQILDGIRNQLEQHLHTSVYGEHIQASQVRLAEYLAESLPPSLNCTYFVNSGAEAVEGALKVARKYTTRHEVIACRNAYHGSTAGAESLRSDVIYTAASRPLVPGIRHVDFNSFEDLQKITEHTAAVIVEPIQGEAGVILPVSDYLQALGDQCAKTGALLIFDEIQTGMGRTGSLFAFQKENVVPDILLLGKAFGGGLPLGAFISEQEIMQVLAHDPVLGHLTTFGGHPLSCAASIAAFEILEKENLPARAAKSGDKMAEKLRLHALVQEVRGSGLMMAVELADPVKVKRAMQACREEGLLLDSFLFNDRSIRLYPPLIISDTEIEMLCDKMHMALNHC